jgi:N-acetylglucosamine-6-phosphate deacetylase
MTVHPDDLDIPLRARDLPVEVHCHGFDDVDFSEFATLDPVTLDRKCAREAVLCIPTLYLHRDRLGEFEGFMRRFGELRRAGRLPHLVGVALEGPLLSSHGGTPAATVWAPTRHEWERLAALGRHGLLYMVMSPDAFTPASGLYPNLDSRHPRFDWIVPLLMQHGVRPALGHFMRADPPGSAELVRDIVALAWTATWTGAGARAVTDHLFNDMPLTIRHAFRTSAARASREATLAGYRLHTWTLDDLPEIAGPVPAAIMREAAAGRISACVNFDGEHVDLAIARRAVELMGPDRAMVMTDRCDSARIGGQELFRSDENGLWYQSGGIVAAGSQPLARQIRNGLNIGIPYRDMWQLAARSAHASFAVDVEEMVAAERTPR